MRVLIAGKGRLTKDQEREWSPDQGGNRIRHMIPDPYGNWHYAYTSYVTISGVRTKLGYWCPKCDRGALLDP